MYRQFKIHLVLVVGVGCLLCSCSKDDTTSELVPDNDAPYYDKVATVLVQNYINRLYIDLIGREPLDIEMEADVAFLRKTNLSFESRDSLVRRLQTDEQFIEGDSSYKAAYYNRLYELFKVKMIEGASDADISRERSMILSNIIRDSIAGDYYQIGVNWEKFNKLNAVLDIQADLREGRIEIKDAFARLLNNQVYDKINMNTFNFLRAAFNDLFGRFPTQAEFDNGYLIVEDNSPSWIFGQSASTKDEFIEVLVNSNEFYEGLIRWTYSTLLAREATTFEIEAGMTTFATEHSLPDLQRTILITDEYANFNQ